MSFAAVPDLESEPDPENGRPQVMRIHHLGDQRPDMRLGLRLAVDDAAEQDVVLQRGGAVVARLIIEFDGIAERVREVPGEGSAGDQDTLPS